LCVKKILLIPDVHGKQLVQDLNKYEQENPKELNRLMTETLKKLNYLHAVLLRFLIQFLSVFATHSESTKMTADNIAICFGPNIIRLMDASLATASSLVIAYMIRNYDVIFETVGEGTQQPPEPEQKKKKALKSGFTSPKVRRTKAEKEPKQAKQKLKLSAGPNNKKKFSETPPTSSNPLANSAPNQPILADSPTSASSPTPISATITPTINTSPSTPLSPGRGGKTFRPRSPTNPSSSGSSGGKVNLSPMRVRPVRAGTAGAEEKEEKGLFSHSPIRPGRTSPRSSSPRKNRPASILGSPSRNRSPSPRSSRPTSMMRPPTPPLGFEE